MYPAFNGMVKKQFCRFELQKI